MQILTFVCPDHLQERKFFHVFVMELIRNDTDYPEIKFVLHGVIRQAISALVNFNTL